MKKVASLITFLVCVAFCNAQDQKSQEMADAIVKDLQEKKSKIFTDHQVGDFKDFKMAEASIKINGKEYYLNWSDVEGTSVLKITSGKLILKDTGTTGKLSDPKLNQEYQTVLSEITTHLTKGLAENVQQDKAKKEVAKNP